MSATTDEDRPPETGPADVTLVTRGVTVAARVEVSGVTRIVVQPTAPERITHLAVKRDDAVEVFWRADYEERMLPARIDDVAPEEDGPRWVLAVTGKAQRSQRRKAVRAHVALPVLLVCNGTQLTGHTVDLSEAGMRVDVDGWGLPPESGTPVQISLTIDDDEVLDLHAEIVRHGTHGSRWQLSMFFDSLADRVQDRVRQRVFQALRDELARAAD